jgi:sugar/nucleoside kinase (ribokinase family)
MKPILAVGDCNADLVLTQLSAAPQPGREALALGCSLTLGGSSTIFAAGVGQLGYPVAFAGKIGRDDLGDVLLRLLKARRVNVSRVKRDPKSRTGITVAISQPPDRALVTFPGTIAQTRVEELRLGGLAKFSHLHTAGYFLQPTLQTGLPALLAKARKAGVSTSFDPGWDPDQKWKLDAVLPHVDIFFVNHEEAGAMTGLTRSDDAAVALSRRVKIAVVKLGPAGALAAQNGNVVRAPAYRVQPVDTTGAGDTFDAGFVVALRTGKTLHEALALGNACGALSTLKPGGYDAQPTMKQAMQLMRAKA